MIYGYVRISRPTQKMERQITNILKEYPDAKIYQEAYTGTKIVGRKVFERLLHDVAAGDTIVFDSVSRMSRNAEDGISVYFELYNKDVNLIFLKEPYINTSVYKNSINQGIEKTGHKIADIYIEATNEVIKILASEQIIKAFEQAQKEVDDLRERTAEGIREARKKGKQIGQQKGRTLNIKQKAPAKEKIFQNARAFGGTLYDYDCMKIAGVSRVTYYKYKKELLEEHR